MIEHPGYAAFATWCESQLIYPYQIYFQVWLASRQQLEVKLPSEDTCRTSTSEEEAVQEAYNHALGECRAAIVAQGLKVAL